MLLPYPKNGDQDTLTEDIKTGYAQIIEDKMGVWHL